MDGDLVYIKELSSVGSGAAVLTFTILLPSKKETHQKGREGEGEDYNYGLVEGRRASKTDTR